MTELEQLEKEILELKIQNELLLELANANMNLWIESEKRALANIKGNHEPD